MAEYAIHEDPLLEEEHKVSIPMVSTSDLGKKLNLRTHFLLLTN